MQGVAGPAPESSLKGGSVVGTQGLVSKVGREFSDNIPFLTLHTRSILLSQEILRALLFSAYTLYIAPSSVWGVPSGTRPFFPLVTVIQPRKLLQGG